MAEEPKTDLGEMPEFKENLVSEVPLLAPVGGAPEEAANAPPPEDSAPPPRSKGFEAMQRRIEKLFAQKRAAEEAVESERARNRELEERLARLEAERAVPAPETPSRELGDLRGFVREAMEPFVRRLEERERIEALADAHEASWLAAEEEWPELAVETSDLSQLSKTILFRDEELLRSPNGPYKAVAIAAGMLAASGEKRSPQTLVGPAETESTGRLPALRKELKRLMERGLSGYEDYAEAKRLRAEIARLESRPRE